ncbi:MAG: VOC family protein [Rhodomicrobium sp.]
MAGFYESALGFLRREERSIGSAALGSLLCIPGAEAHIITMKLGKQTIELVNIKPAGHPYPEEVSGWSSLFQHFAIVVSDMAAAYARLWAHKGWHPISLVGAQVLPASSGGVTAFKFRDPEGHPLELLAFTPGAMPEPWKKAGDRDFLGIDHSAISVADTFRSVEFYRQLGFQRSGGSLNTGPAQDRLDNAKGAVVEVTALAPPEEPPHVELLCYREVSRHDPRVSAINDVAATQLMLEASSIGALHAFHAQNADAFVSRLVAFEDGVARAIVRDPDGHLIRLEAPL